MSKPRHKEPPEESEIAFLRAFNEDVGQSYFEGMAALGVHTSGMQLFIEGVERYFIAREVTQLEFRALADVRAPRPATQEPGSGPGGRP